MINNDMLWLLLLIPVEALTFGFVLVKIAALEPTTILARSLRLGGRCAAAGSAFLAVAIGFLALGSHMGLLAVFLAPELWPLVFCSCLAIGFVVCFAFLSFTSE